jgi:hypothetical protein
MWYVGAHYSVGCHPDDGYICSSKTVKPLITESIDEWQREILVIGDPVYIVELEAKYLTLLDAKNDQMSYNGHNGDGKFHTAGRKEPEEAKKKRIKKLIGIKRSNTENLTRANRLKAKDPAYLAKLRGPKPPGHGKNVSKATTGVPKSKAHRQAMSKARKGKKTGPCSDERREAIRLSQKGKPCNNPVVTCPHCGKSGHSGAMVRWHFDNCKERKI